MHSYKIPAFSSVYDDAGLKFVSRRSAPRWAKLSSSSTTPLSIEKLGCKTGNQSVPLSKPNARLANDQVKKLNACNCSSSGIRNHTFYVRYVPGGRNRKSTVIAISCGTTQSLSNKKDENIEGSGAASLLIRVYLSRLRNCEIFELTNPAYSSWEIGGISSRRFFFFFFFFRGLSITSRFTLYLDLKFHGWWYRP